MNLIDIIKKKFKKGDKLYSIIFGNVIFLSTINDTEILTCLEHQPDHIVKFLFDGSFIKGGECALFPSSKERDWINYAFNIQKGDILLASENKTSWKLFRYHSYDPVRGQLVLSSGCGRICISICKWCVVPINNFDFYDLESNISKNIFNE